MDQIIQSDVIMGMSRQDFLTLAGVTSTKASTLLAKNTAVKQDITAKQAA